MLNKIKLTGITVFLFCIIVIILPAQQSAQANSFIGSWTWTGQIQDYWSGDLIEVTESLNVNDTGWVLTSAYGLDYNPRSRYTISGNTVNLIVFNTSNESYGTGTVSGNTFRFRRYDGFEQIFNRVPLPRTGLYAKESGITNADIPVAGVAANNIAAAVNYVNRNPGVYTMFIDQNVNAGSLGLNAANSKLIIVGIGGRREIQYNGPLNSRLFTVTNNTALILGDMITVRGINNSSTALISAEAGGILHMFPGSRITGHTSSSASGVVEITGGNSKFFMEGGMNGRSEITGNISSSNADENTATGGVRVNDGGQFINNGGTVSGNFRNRNIPADVLIMPDAGEFINSGSIGKLVPADYTGTWQILTSHNLALEVRNSSTENGAAIQISGNNGTAVQRWRFERQPNGTYIITNVHTNRAMDVNGGSSKENGAPVEQWTRGSGDSQQWRITAAGDGLVKFVNVMSDKVLTIPGDNINNFHRPGIQMYQWDDNPNVLDGQVFRLVPVR